jgi:hypothetical protein
MEPFPSRGSLPRSSSFIDPIAVKGSHLRVSPSLVATVINSSLDQQPPPPFDESVGLYAKTLLPDHVKIPGNPLVEPDAVSISQWIDDELHVGKLNEIHGALWWAGRPGNLRSLHRQLMMHRKLLITEDPALHLVWYEKTIYIKPLPEFLLCWRFYRDRICPDPSRAACAAGFLSTYLRLVSHRSDFRIGVQLGLLPDGLTRDQWSAFAASLRGNLGHVPLNKRYRYGEG